MEHRPLLAGLKSQLKELALVNPHLGTIRTFNTVHIHTFSKPLGFLAVGSLKIAGSYRSILW